MTFARDIFIAAALLILAAALGTVAGIVHTGAFQ